jgi:predicted RNA-binding Zn-ribbon protein involved in translation (DUF1610 family)
MNKFIAIALILSLLAPVYGCATLKNTKVPKAFKEVGVCANCRQLIALDELADGDSAVCPECGAWFIVKDAKAGFAKKMVSLKNGKMARSFMAITWLAASIAGIFYGIPIPPPVIDKETFSPYQAPFRISCRRAIRASEAAPHLENLYMPVKLSNPYEADRVPYCLVIDDYEGAALKKISESSHALMDEPAIIYGKSRMLKMKN